MSDERWREQALCAHVDPSIFFVEKGGSSQAAKRICNKCPVKAPCLEFGLEHDYGYDAQGIYGGLSPKERSTLKTQKERIYCTRGHRMTDENREPNGRCRKCHSITRSEAS